MLTRSSYPLISPRRGQVRPPSRGIRYCCPPIPALIESAQRLRYDVFSNEPGFALTGRGRRPGRGPFRRALRPPAGPRGQLRRAGWLLPHVVADRCRRGRGALYRNRIRHHGAGCAAAVARGDGTRGRSRRSPQRRGRAADVGRHPGLPRPMRLRLCHRLRVGSRYRHRRTANHRALRFAACGTSSCAGTPPRRSTGCTRTGR